MFSTTILNLFTLLLLTPTIIAFSPAGGDVGRSSIPEEYRNQARDLIRFPSRIQSQGGLAEVEVLKRHFKRSGIKGKRGLKGKRACKAGTTTTAAGSVVPTSTGMASSTLAPTATSMVSSSTEEESKTFESLVITASSLPVANAPVIPTSSSSIPAPSSSIAPSTSTKATSIKSSSAAPAATTSASSGFKSKDYEGNGPFNGESTYYVLGTDGNAIGACGNNLVDSDLIAAASEYLFDSWPGANGNPNQNPICGQYAKVSYQGKSVVVRIEDRCPGCEKRHLDLSPSAFSQLASFDVGMMDVTWEWVGSASG